MTGYTRQSLATIIATAVVNAAPLNAEFDAILAAMHGTTGHAHDGTTGSGPKIHLVNSVDTATKLGLAYGGTNATLASNTAGDTVVIDAATTALTVRSNNLVATTSPGVTNDGTEGYGIGSMWVNLTLDLYFVCVDITTGAAVWLDATGGVSAIAAAASAAAALVSENNAATSETNAATSETNAATSETNAATSETNAGVSETNAAASETAAAASAVTADAAGTAAALAVVATVTALAEAALTIGMSN